MRPQAPRPPCVTTGEPGAARPGRWRDRPAEDAMPRRRAWRRRECFLTPLPSKPICIVYWTCGDAIQYRPREAASPRFAFGSCDVGAPAFAAGKEPRPAPSYAPTSPAPLPTARVPPCSLGPLASLGALWRRGDPRRRPPVLRPSCGESCGEIRPPELWGELWGDHPSCGEIRSRDCLSLRARAPDAAHSRTA
jgi:hypothetical protein